MLAAQRPGSPAPSSDPLPGSPRLKPGVFRQVQKFIYDTAGIDIQDGKEEMVTARLWKRARLRGLDSVEAFLAAVEADASGSLLAELIDSLTTNYTSFFREPAHFDFLRTRILPVLRRRSRFQIWTAASSTGEEPYSIAITLLEELGPEAARQARILASDISTRVLEIARTGIYPAERFRGFPEDWRRRYLQRGREGQAGLFRLRPEVRALVEFRQINIVNSLPGSDLFPLIFLRNIMIYFDRPTQEKVVAALSARLEAGGYLFLGHSESLNGIRHDLEHVQVAVYRKAGGPPSGLSSAGAYTASVDLAGGRG